jgi:6-phosphofructokinase 1
MESHGVSEGKLGILVGGGPAPGINSVIGAATIRGRLAGLEVLGIRDGFQWIMKGDTSRITPLTIPEVSRIHLRGGWHIGTARANPTKDPKHLETVVEALQKLGITKLVTIGGDDTAFSSMSVAKRAGGTLRVVHVPKTIDNDLDLPPYIDTFGYQTARHVGAGLVQTLMVDAKTTSRWYLVVAMGRTAGHLALGIGNAAGATLTLIPEEFSGPTVRLKTLADSIAGSIIKRLSQNRPYGVAVVAEGLGLSIDPADLSTLDQVERDEHGHVRLAELDLGEIVKRQVQARLKSLGISITIASKNIGYELRCADPIPFDVEYTRMLGYCATKFLLEGGHAAMVSLQAGKFVPVPFDEMLDPETGRARVRRVDLGSTSYAIARRYMIRLRRDDFDDEAELSRLAATANLPIDRFRAEFEYLTGDEPPPIRLETGA